MVKNNRNYRNKMQEQSGFTLLEIIAVIVILSILGVVALPKYFDLQNQARDKAMGAGISEAIGRVNGYFAQEVLNGARPSEINYVAELNGGDMGDFELGVANSGTDENPTITLTITGRAGTPIAGETREVIVPRPGL